MLPAVVNAHVTEEDVLISIFWFVSNAISMISCDRPLLLEGKHPKGPARKLSSSEMISLGIFKAILGFEEVKQLYWHINNHYHEHFPYMPCYRNFCKQYNEAIIPSTIIMQFMMYITRKTKQKGLHFMDSSALPVCKNVRIAQHKVAKKIAGFGKTSAGWFYGFKIHLVISPDGFLENVTFSAGNVDDRAGAKKLVHQLFGQIVTDGGYMGIKWGNAKRWFFSSVRKNMKKLMSMGQHGLFRQRQYVETVIGILKHRLRMPTSLPRSITGYFARYVYVLLAYIFQRSF